MYLRGVPPPSPSDRPRTFTLGGSSPTMTGSTVKAGDLEEGCRGGLQSVPQVGVGIGPSRSLVLSWLTGKEALRTTCAERVRPGGGLVGTRSPRATCALQGPATDGVEMACTQCVLPMLQASRAHIGGEETHFTSFVKFRHSGVPSGQM